MLPNLKKNLKNILARLFVLSYELILVLTAVLL